MPCTGRWVVSGTTWQVPFHTIRGPSVPPLLRGKFTCPGALVGLRFGTTEPDTPSMIAMEERGAIYQQRVEEIKRAEQARIAQLRAEAGEVDEEPELRPEGHAPDTETHGEVIYFPGRPADAPEPGPGESATQPVDYGNVAGHHLGKAAMEDAHATARALTILARDKMNETLGKLAGCANALNGSVGLATMAEMEATAAQALVIAAVGTGAGKPTPAEQMAEQTALAVSTIMGTEGDNIFNAIEVARIRVELAAQQLTAAVEQANQYIALLS